MNGIRLICVAIFIACALACSGVGSKSETAPGPARGEPTIQVDEVEPVVSKEPEPVALDPADNPVPAEPSATAQSGVQTGTLSKASRGSIVLQGASGDVPPIGASGEVLKKVDKKMGSMSFSAWLTIASVEVTKVSGKSVTMKVVEEMSQITVNGKKTNHFTPGSRLKLEWKK